MREAIRNIAKTNNIMATRITEKEIEFYEKNKVKMRKFVEQIRERCGHNIKFIELSSIGMDKDVKGNTLEGCKALYMLEPEPEQLSLL